MKKVPLLLALGFIFLLACNNESEKTETTDSVTTKTDSTTQKPMATHQVGAVELSANDVIDLLDANNNNNGPKMIYFEFDFSSGSDVVVRAHARDSEGNQLPDVDIPLRPVTASPTVQFSYSESSPYSNIIVRGHLKQFLGFKDYKDVPIRANQFTKPILLTPCLRADGKVEFILTYMEDPRPNCSTPRANQAGKIVSNPSPPGTPACMDACDDPGFTFMTK